MSPAAKPVAILRFSPTEGPGYFGTFLEERGIAWKLIAVDAGEPVPTSAHSFAGIGLMGGPMSVNDDLPWIDKTLDLIRDAVDEDVPTIGHCLGGQLLAKALGATVTQALDKEIGWGEIRIAQNEEAQRWFGGDINAFLGFHWHGETFGIPEHATRIMSSRACENQGFVFDRHLSMQCHVEMTPELISAWCKDWAKEFDNPAAACATPSVQDVATIQTDMGPRVHVLNAVARRLYTHWIKGLRQ